MVVGFHVPAIEGLFVELVGSFGGVEFLHNGPIGLKVGVMDCNMVMFILAVVAHCPVLGVKV